MIWLLTNYSSTGCSGFVSIRSIGQIFQEWVDKQFFSENRNKVSEWQHLLWFPSSMWHKRGRMHDRWSMSGWIVLRRKVSQKIKIHFHQIYFVMHSGRLMIRTNSKCLHSVSETVQKREAWQVTWDAALKEQQTREVCIFLFSSQLQLQGSTWGCIIWNMSLLQIILNS